MQTVQKSFISLILPYKVRKKTALLRFTVNQAGTGLKLHFQPKHLAMAKSVAITNKNGCGHGWGVMQRVRKSFISLILTYKARKKRCCFFLLLFGHIIHYMIDCCVPVCLLFPPEEPLQSPNLSPAVWPCLHVLQFLWFFFLKYLPRWIQQPQELCWSPAPLFRLVASRRPIES